MTTTDDLDTKATYPSFLGWWLWAATGAAAALAAISTIGVFVAPVAVVEAAACGGLNPLPWLVSGVVLVTGPVVFLRHRRTRVTGRSSHRR